MIREQNEQLRALLELVRDLEIPAIPLLDGVLLVPVVGRLDTRRVSLLQERVIETVYTQRAHTVILDLTGITMVDTSVAQAVEQFIATLLGVSFNGVQIASRVQEGIAAVLQPG